MTGFFENLFGKKPSAREIQESLDFCQMRVADTQLAIEGVKVGLSNSDYYADFIAVPGNEEKFNNCVEVLIEKIRNVDNLKDFAVTSNEDNDTGVLQSHDYIKAQEDLEKTKSEWKKELGDDNTFRAAFRLANLEKTLQTYEKSITQLEKQLEKSPKTSPKVSPQVTPQNSPKSTKK